MATVSFSPAGDVLYAYLAGEIDHDAAQSCASSWMMHWSAVPRRP